MFVGLLPSALLGLGLALAAGAEPPPPPAPVDELPERSLEPDAAPAPPPAPPRAPPREEPPPDEPRPVDDGSLFGDPIARLVSTPPATLGLHAGLSCLAAALLYPSACLPCGSWVLYPLLMGLAIDGLGGLVADRDGSFWLTTATFFLSQIVGAAALMAFFVVSAISLSIVLSGNPTLVTLLFPTTGGPSYPLYGMTAALAGLYATILALTTFASLTTFYVTAPLPPPEADERRRSRRRPRRRPMRY